MKTLEQKRYEIEDFGYVFEYLSTRWWVCYYPDELPDYVSKREDLDVCIEESYQYIIGVYLP